MYDGGSPFAARPGPVAARLRDRGVALDAVGAYVVVVDDADTGEVDAYGPYSGDTAWGVAAQIRQVFDRDDVDHVEVSVTRLR